MKETTCECAGIFTAPFLASYYLEIFDELDAVDAFIPFATQFEPDCYKPPYTQDTCIIAKQTKRAPSEIAEIVPFMVGKNIHWAVQT